MKKLQLWKLKRELLRLCHNTLSAPRQAWEYLTLTTRYDLKAARRRKVHSGEMPLRNEAAVYLIFPAKGLLASHLDMLRQLNDHGISPILVSNLPLCQKDLATLQPLCTRIIERPNIGYDFGGYRDGILNLAPVLPDLDRLYLLNDSCWMIDRTRSWFDEVRDADVDLCGASAHLGLRPHEVRKIVWSDKTEHPRFHYTAYALALGKNILRDAAFLGFWRKFHMSNDKSINVRRGEIGLTQWVLRQKRYSHTASCALTDLDKEIAALGDDELDAVTRNLVISVHPKLRVRRDEILNQPASSPEGRADRIKFILTTVTSAGLSYALAFYTVRSRGFQFVKKSPLWLSRSGSDTMIALLDDLTGPMAQNAAREARNLRPAEWPKESSHPASAAGAT